MRVILRQIHNAKVKTLLMGRELPPNGPQRLARCPGKRMHWSLDNDRGATEWLGLIRLLDQRAPDYEA
ncbi:MAG: hypothetical protein AAF460_14025 [Pseudomonadota bacterium]